jgi:hypothetical protein
VELDLPGQIPISEDDISRITFASPDIYHIWITPFAGDLSSPSSGYFGVSSSVGQKLPSMSGA